MTEDINHFVEEYRLYVHNADERNKVVSRAVNALGDTCTEELLIKKSKELDDKRIKKFW